MVVPRNLIIHFRIQVVEIITGAGKAAAFRYKWLNKKIDISAPCRNYIRCLIFYDRPLYRESCCNEANACIHLGLVDITFLHCNVNDRG